MMMWCQTNKYNNCYLQLKHDYYNCLIGNHCFGRVLVNEMLSLFEVKMIFWSLYSCPFQSTVLCQFKLYFFFVCWKKTFEPRYISPCSVQKSCSPLFSWTKKLFSPTNESRITVTFYLVIAAPDITSSFFTTWKVTTVLQHNNRLV